MSMFLAKVGRRLPDGTPYRYLVIKENRWDPEFGGTRQRMVGYVGKEPVLPLSKAERICAKRGLTLEDLEGVNGLTIVDDDTGEPLDAPGGQRAFDFAQG